MQIKTENGYVSSYAWIGNIVGGIEVPDPPDTEHFEAHFTAYRVKDGVLEYDENRIRNSNERHFVTSCVSGAKRSAFPMSTGASPGMTGSPMNRSRNSPCGTRTGSW